MSGGDWVRCGIDLGNSAAKWSIIGSDGRTAAGPPNRVPLDRADWPAQLVADVVKVAGQRRIHWRIASVNRPAREALTSRLESVEATVDVTAITWRDVPMNTRLLHPERAGIDRLLGVWKATRLYPGTAVVVVDAGSAVTIDCADAAGEFLGGAILPGLRLQFDSLARGTDALPQVDQPQLGGLSPEELPVPATDTVGAIRGGILLGTAAAIDGLIGRIVECLSRVPPAEPPVAVAAAAVSGESLDASHPQQAGQSEPPQYRVLLTGGDAGRLTKLISRPHEVVERLVVDAILDERLELAQAM